MTLTTYSAPTLFDGVSQIDVTFVVKVKEYGPKAVFNPHSAAIEYQMGTKPLSEKNLEKTFSFKHPLLTIGGKTIVDLLNKETLSYEFTIENEFIGYEFKLFESHSVVQPDSSIKMNLLMVPVLKFKNKTNYLMGFGAKEVKVHNFDKLIAKGEVENLTDAMQDLNTYLDESNRRAEVKNASKSLSTKMPLLSRIFKVKTV